MSIDPPPEPHPAVPSFASTRVPPSCIELPPMSRKTRDQPNLAECNGCGLRINTSNGKDKLRPLNSEWRIVLLCRTCFKQCFRGEVCTYCLGEVSEVSEGGEVFKCGECCCKVHKECVVRFKDFAPWSYFDWRGSRVCVDCWLPGKVVKLREVEGCGKGRGIRNLNVGKKKLMENGVGVGQDVDGEDVVAERKVRKGKLSSKARLGIKAQLGYKVREKCLGEALVEKVGMGKENDGLGLGVSGEELSGKSKKDVDDAELAFQLHRVMNSSPRISRNVGTLSTNLIGVRKRRGGSNLAFVKQSALEENASKGFDAKDGRVDGILKEGQGSCSNNSVESDHFSWKELDLPKPDLRFTYIRRKFRPIDDGKSGRYMFKYSRKNSRLKQVVNRKYIYLYDKSSYESETSSAVMLLPSSNELTKFPDDCVLALPVSASGKGFQE